VKRLISAKMIQQPPEDTEETATQRPGTRVGSIAGTVANMSSPEQAMRSPVGPRSDIFSLGTVLYECLTGRRPFSGATAREVAANAIFTNPPPPSILDSWVPPELDRIILKMLEKKPEARYQSAGKLVADLRSVHERLPQEEFGDVTPLPHRSFPQVHLLLLARFFVGERPIRVQSRSRSDATFLMSFGCIVSGLPVPVTNHPTRLFRYLTEGAEAAISKIHSVSSSEFELPFDVNLSDPRYLNFEQWPASEEGSDSRSL
jgi:serine/threonine protein kinase